MLGNIQILRFVAAALVVLFHVARTVDDQGRPSALLAHFGSWGQSGVDMFFVISGLVMVLSQARSRRSAGQFLLERAARILPMYWVLTLLFAGMLLFLPDLSDKTFSASKTLASLFFVNGLLEEDYPVLYVGWTLEYEWVFYLVFSLSFALLPLGYSWLAVFVAFLVLSYAGLIEFLAVEFVYGMLIGLATLRGFRLPAPGLFVIAGFALLLATAFFPFPQLPRYIGYGIPASLIVAGLVALPQARGRAALILGATSYSIYLVQVFSIPATFRIVSKFPDLSNDLAAILMALGILLSGVLAYIFVERPLARLFHAWLGSRRSAMAIARHSPAR